MTESNFPLDVSTTEQTLDMLGLRWRSGKVLALAGETSFGLHLAAGRIIFATSTQRSLRLGQLLLRLGSIRTGFLDQVLHGGRVQSRTTTLGRVLIREGAISRADLATGVEEQCVEVLSRMIDVPDATFLHVSDDPLPVEIEIVPLETDRMLNAAAIRSDSRAAVRAMQFVLPDSGELLVAADGIDPQLLTDNEMLVIFGVQRGFNRLDDLCSNLPLDPLTVKRTVVGLLERGRLVRTSA